MQQLGIFPDDKNKEKICAFTGHRELDEDFCAERLLEVIKNAVNEGVFTFLNGLAVGFDLIAAELLLSLKTEYPQIKLIACIPCAGQDKYYSKENKIRYRNVLLVADEQVILSDDYYRGCMQVRDKYMAERANRMITYCKKKEGGTAYTVRCFQKAHPDGEVIFI